ncbi:MAG: hypothetical protein Q9227_001318 [Pyrenula ochraceoflavens]
MPEADLPGYTQDADISQLPHHTEGSSASSLYNNDSWNSPICPLSESRLKMTPHVTLYHASQLALLNNQRAVPSVATTTLGAAIRQGLDLEQFAELERAAMEFVGTCQHEEDDIDFEAMHRIGRCADCEVKEMERAMKKGKARDMTGKSGG